MTELFQDGDILLTYGRGGIYPPRRMLLWLVYQGIRKYQKARWVDHFGIEDADIRPTHVRIFSRGRFAEATTPICQWTDIKELDLHKKEWKLCRHEDYQKLNKDKLYQWIEQHIGDPYDTGDLLDFALSGFLHRLEYGVSLFGDRRDKFNVCSMFAQRGSEYAGLGFNVEKADPAYFANDPSYNTITKYKP